MKKEDIVFVCTMGPCGDETSYYEVNFPPATISEFINCILSNTNEYGTFYLESFFEDSSKICDYKNGEITYIYNKKKLKSKKKYTSCNANGGWSLMDYFNFE